MGWLGWTEDQTMAHTPAAILLAKKGRADMINTVLRVVFPPKDGTPEGKLEHKLKPTAANLRMVFTSLANAEKTGL